jgi:hypothetical protein
VTPLLLLHGLVAIHESSIFAGDANLDQAVNVSDAIAILKGLFLGLPTIVCFDAADFDGTGTVNVTDPIVILSYLFEGGPAAPARDVSCAEERGP